MKKKGKTKKQKHPLTRKVCRISRYGGISVHVPTLVKHMEQGAKILEVPTIGVKHINNRYFLTYGGPDDWEEEIHPKPIRAFINQCLIKREYKPSKYTSYVLSEQH